MYKELLQELKKSLIIIYPVLIIFLIWMMFCNIFCYIMFVQTNQMSIKEYCDLQLAPTIITLILLFLSKKSRNDKRK